MTDNNPAMMQGSLTQHRLLAEGQRLNLTGNHAAAATIFRQILKQTPHDIRANYELAIAERGLGKLEEAKARLEKLNKAGPQPAFHHELCMVHRKAGRFEEALKAIDRAIRMAPGEARLHAAKAETLSTMGQAAEAYESIRGFVEAGKLDLTIAKIFARIAPKIGKREEALVALRAAIDSGRPAEGEAGPAWFLLGELLDGVKDYDGAFEAYRRGNELRRIAFDPEAHSRKVDAMLSAWTRPAVAALPRASIKSDRPAFILGMPRSGTSLVEQILASHPKVAGAGELNDISRIVHRWSGTMAGNVPLLHDLSPVTKPAVDKAARDYLETLRQVSPIAARVTDKMPPNFQHIGLISLMFPKAPIFHCMRDPIDTCVSCYFQNFSGNNPFAYDLAHLGRFYRDYLRIMAHWKEVLDTPIHDVVYEDMVAGQEAGSRRLVELIGLPWDDACLRFHESDRIVLTSSNDQVRRPMYTTSVARWKRYEKHLGPLLEALHA